MVLISQIATEYLSMKRNKYGKSDVCVQQLNESNSKETEFVIEERGTVR